MKRIIPIIISFSLIVFLSCISSMLGLESTVIKEEQPTFKYKNISFSIKAVKSPGSLIQSTAHEGYKHVDVNITITNNATSKLKINYDLVLLATYDGGKQKAYPPHYVWRGFTDQPDHSITLTNRTEYLKSGQEVALTMRYSVVPTSKLAGVVYNKNRKRPAGRFWYVK